MAFSLGAATVDITGKTGGLSRSLKGARGMFSKAGASIGRAAVSLAAFVGAAFALKKIITLYGRQEAAEIDLAAALRARGLEVTNNLKRMKEFASEM